MQIFNKCEFSSFNSSLKKYAIYSLMGNYLATFAMLGVGAEPAMDKVDTAKMFVRGGELEAEKSNWEEAVKKFDEAIKLTDSSSIAYYDLGVAQFHLGELENAAQAEKRAIALDPKFVDAYIQLAAILSKLEDYPGAEDILERALKVDEHCVIARNSLNELCVLKKSQPELFAKRSRSTTDEKETQRGRDIDASDLIKPTVDVTKLKHSG